MYSFVLNRIMNLIQSLSHPKVVGHAFFIPLIIQACIFHPYYQHKPRFRLARQALTPIIILMVLASVQNRLWEPLNEYMMINFPFVSLITFHAICLAIQFGFHDGPIIKVEKVESLHQADTTSNPSQTVTEETVDHQSIKNLIREDVSVNSIRSTEEKPMSLSSRPTTQDKSTTDEGSRPSLGELVRFAVWIVLR